jgi:amino acid adenylation domain-containing protein
MNLYQHAYTSEQYIQQLFEEQVEFTPDAIAVAYDDELLTYRELNRYANQLAHYLQTLGVLPETLVGVCLERSVEMLIAILGVLKSGGGYVPLDPAYPEGRLAFMLHQSQAAVLLTQEHLRERLCNTGTQIVYLNTDWHLIMEQRPENLNQKLSPECLAYVIYTSGSTGVPKGVMISHQAITNHMRWMQDTFSLSATDRVLQKTPFSFDASVWEFYAPLLVGACLVLARPGTHGDSQYLVHTIVREQITVIQVVPTLLHILLDEPAIANCSSLKYLFCGGEELRPELQSRALTTLSAHTRLCNLYGPTECTIDTTFWICEQESQLSRVPIGSPLANIQLFILNTYLQPVPRGVPGELYIGGVQVARGYLYRPDITAERFIPDPFHTQPGARLYRTGDLVRSLPNGMLEYLGRLDQQVKLRGYRIELGEIEVTLQQHPQVRECVILAREDTPGHKRLVAYVVQDTNANLQLPDAAQQQEQIAQWRNVWDVVYNQPLQYSRSAGKLVSALRQHLKQHLPDYMLPSAFVFLDAFPLMPNGKIDRHNLPAPETARTPVRERLAAPSTPLEEDLLKLWAEIFGREDIGIHDNFFAEGGESLLAARMISRIRKTLGIEISLRILFEGPTVASLAKNIEIARRRVSPLDRPAITRLNTYKDKIPLSFGQQRLWFLDQLQPGSSAYNEPDSLRLVGSLDFSALQQSLQEIANRHEILRTLFVQENGVPHQVILPAREQLLSLIDLRAVPQAQREALALQLAYQETSRPFDLAHDTLLRTTLLCLDDTEHWLLFTWHHIISDAWSTGVFFGELSALYNAFLRAEPSPLPSLPIQYADYAIWQRHWLEGTELARQIDYWKLQLAEAPTLLEQPTDYPRSASASDHSSTHFFTLPQPLRDALVALSHREGTTLFITFFAAFTTLLHRYTGQTDIVVGTPIANRGGVEIEKLIGFFLNTVALRSDLTNNPTFQEFLQREKAMVLDAYAHQEAPFEKLIKELQLVRDLNYHPLFQTMFVLQDSPLPALQLSGLSPSSLPIYHETAKFDLTLNVENTDQGLNARFEYKTALFKPQTIERMACHFQTLLEGIISEPGQRILELPILTPDESQQILVTWNATQVEHIQTQNLPQIFERQVLRTPDATAVTFKQEHLSYQELNRRANQLAHYLQTLGVGPDVRVGICIERSLEMVIGLLGILKAGGAYVPMDPAYPTERLRLMLQDAQVPILLTQRRLLPALLEHNARAICLDTDWKIIAHQSGENLQSGALPDNLAYVIYTSGSTGKPKAVALNHRALCNRIAFMVQTLQVSRGRTLQFASLSFDVSFHEMFSTWGSGGIVALMGEELRRDILGLWRLIKEEAMEEIFVPGVVLQQLAETVDDRKVAYSKLREINVGGEQMLITPQVSNLFSKLKNCTLYNDYGPSETHGVTIFILEAVLKGLGSRGKCDRMEEKEDVRTGNRECWC